MEAIVGSPFRRASMMRANVIGAETAGSLLHSESQGNLMSGGDGMSIAAEDKLISLLLASARILGSLAIDS